VRIIHTGDIHFNSNLLKEITKCADYLVEKVQQDPPDVVVIAGDLFDERQTYDSPAFLAAVDFIHRLSDHAPVLIIQGTPSHDGHTLKFLKSDRVYIAENPDQVVLTEDGFIDFDGQLPEGVKVLFSCLPSVSKARVLNAVGADLNGTNFNTIELLRDVLAGWGISNAAVKAAGVPVVLVSHLTVMGARLSTGQQMIGREVELGVEDLRSAKCDLVCLGHIHKMQNWGEIHYSGSLTRLNFGEEEEKGFFIHSIEDGTLTSDFVFTPARTMMTVDLDEIPSTDTAIKVSDGAYVRLRYEVAEEDVHGVDEEALKAVYLSSGAGEVKIEKIVVPKERVRAEGISQAVDTTEKLKKWADVTGAELSPGVINKLHVLESDNEEVKPDETAVA